MALTEYAWRWLDERPNLRRRTQELCEGLLRLHVLPSLGDTPLSGLRPATIRTWHASLLKRSRPGASRAAKAYRLVRSILATAVEDDLITKNPRAIRGAGVERPKEQPIATIEQVYALADAIEPRYRALVLTATFTGLRLGELRALTRRRLDLLHATVHVVEQMQELKDGALGQPLFVYLNSMVILGAEPMIVDTGTPANREQWLKDIFSLVEPSDVRWVFLSHDDVDHTGNLDEVMSACPNAQLVCNWAMIERHTNCFQFPLDRCRWIMDGETLDIGDRELAALRPPVYDSPTTRGLFDPTTGVYWAADTLATPLPDPQMGVADLDPDFWTDGLALFALGAVSPWLSFVERKYGLYVDRVQSLGITTIASCHSPVIEGPLIERAFGHLRQLPGLDPPALPDQSVLDQIIATTSQPHT